MMEWSALIFLASAALCIVCVIRASNGNNADARQGDALLAIGTGAIAVISFLTTLVLFIIEALS